MRLIAADIGDNGALVVVALASADIQASAQTRLRAVGNRQQPRSHRLTFAAVLNRHQRMLLSRLAIDHLRRVHPFNRGVFVQLREQHIAEPGILDHIAQRWPLALLRVELDTAETSALADMDIGDGGGVMVERLPEAETFQDAAAAIRECRGARIEARSVHRWRQLRDIGGGGNRETFRDKYAQCTVAELVQQQRKADADHTAAGDHDIVINRGGAARAHAAWLPRISCSMSPTVLGTSSVSTSQPVFVTTTSSSMRMPMPRHLRATAVLSGAT